MICIGWAGLCIREGDGWMDLLELSSAMEMQRRDALN